MKHHYFCIILVFISLKIYANELNNNDGKPHLLGNNHLFCKTIEKEDKNTNNIQTETIEKALEMYRRESKDPALGFLLGFYPGFGAGHYYAGNIKTGLIITGWEIIGWAFGLNALLYRASVVNPSEDTEKYKLYKKYQIIGGTIVISGILFDSIHSIFVIKKYNREIAEKIKNSVINPYFEFTQNKKIISINIGMSIEF